MAVARFNWQLLAGGGGGQFFPNWQAHYFNNTTLSGAPVLVRDEARISTNWGFASPGPGVNPTFWSARWTRQVSAEAGQYRLILASDDGSRIFINDQLVLDNWREQAPTRRAVDYFTNGGVLNVRVEFFNAAGAAQLTAESVSYTHLDVYKRQACAGRRGHHHCARECGGRRRVRRPITPYTREAPPSWAPARCRRRSHL